MVNRLCTLDPYAQIRSDFGKITTGFDRTAAELDSHQAQISKEVQDRVAAVQGHISAIAAHAAAAITLSPVTGLNANNLQTAVEQLRLMLTTIIAGPAPSAAEILASRVGADNIARNSLDILIKEIHAQQLAANTAAVQLKHGQNVINASEAVPVSVTIKGNTLVNLLGKDGNFEVDSNNDGVADGWSKSSYGTAALSTTSKYGFKSQSIIAAEADNDQYRGVTRRNVRYENGKYYLALVDLTTTGNEGILQIWDGAKNLPSPTRQSTTSKLLYIKWQQTSDTTDNGNIQLINYAPKGAVGSVQFDGVRIYEITAEENAKIGVDPDYSGDKLAERYPYVDGVKHATNPVITKVGKNIFDIDRPFALAGTAGTSAVVESPTSLLITSSTSTYNHAKHETYPVLPNTTYTLSYKAVNISGVDAPAVSVRKGSDLTQLTVREVAGDIVMSFNTGPETSIALYFYGSRATASVQQKRYENIQLEIGAVATLYEPHNDDYCYAVTTLAGYGGVNDVLTVRGAETTVLRHWKTDLVLDGSFPWNHYTSTVVAGRKYVVAPKTNFPLSWQDAGECTLVSPAGAPLSNMKLFTSLNAANQMSMGPSSLTVTIANTDSGWGDDFNPYSAEVRAYFYGYKMNNGTFGQLYNGSGTKTWTRWDAVSNAGAVTTVPTAMADGYTPYKLSYQLATPVPEVVPVEGSLANHAGLNLYEVSEGVILREKVTPKVYGNMCYINVDGNKVSSITGTEFKRRTERILSIHRDGGLDLGWVIMTRENAYGKQRAELLPALYDPTAEYTVTYLALDKYNLTAPVVDGALDYQTSSKSVQQALVQRTADAETAITIHDRILAQHTARLLALEA